MSIVPPDNRLSWFTDARFGLFIHWGPYAVKGFEASWPLVWGQISYHEYESLADGFEAKRYDPVEWAKIAKMAGMRYAVLTAKHHDGFALWDTQYSDYSAVHRGPKRDLIRPYVEAFRDAGLRVGLYFSLCDWHHPDYPIEIADPRPARSRPAKALPPGAPQSIRSSPERWERYINFMFGQIRELCTLYGKIDLLWFDGDWEHTPQEWRIHELIEMIRELQPGIIINNRLADRSLGDYETPEQFVQPIPPSRAWETCMTINETWAYNPSDQAYKTCKELISTLCEVVSKGGNFLLNVGPTADGEIPEPFIARLRTIGEWLQRHGEAIYGTRPGLPPGSCYYGPSTFKGKTLYLFTFGHPGDGIIILRNVTRKVTGVHVLFPPSPLEFTQRRDTLRIFLPFSLLDPYVTVLKIDSASEWEG
jgi:alpha-L-fucosidase